MSALNDVKAGQYQLVAPRWDQITSKPGEALDYIRHKRGDLVDLSAEDAKRLFAAGAVVRPGQLEKARADQARELADRAQREYEAALASLPEDVRAEIAGTPESTPESTPPASTTEPPNRGSSKADWVTYVTSEAAGDKKLDAEAAEAMTRDEIADHVMGARDGA